MRPIKRVGYFLLITTILVLGCDVSTLLAPSAVPSPDPNLVQSIIAQTAARAESQTAVLIIPTITPTLTPFPSQTASVTPTITETFVFKLFTPTKSGDLLGCQVLSQIPTTGFVLGANKPFTANWTVENTGLLSWNHASVDLVHSGGTLLSAKTAYDTKDNVAVGGAETVSVPMTAPSASGTYTSKWSLRSGQNLFCALSVSVTVP